MAKGSSSVIACPASFVFCLAVVAERRDIALSGISKDEAHANNTSEDMDFLTNFT